MRFSNLVGLCLPLAVFAACASEDVASQAPELDAPDYQPVNLAAGKMVLYEMQARTANACDPNVGGSDQRAACTSKIAPKITYRAQGLSCGIIDQLQKIKLGTLDDMIEDTNDYRKGITVRYLNEKVGANTMWLMPAFPNNDQWNIPDGCDNLGSPYAVRDYFHAAGTLSRACIQAQRDEYSSEPCWANDALERVLAEAHRRGMKVMLDIALNHFGHNYLAYDVADAELPQERLNGGTSVDGLWNFDATYDDALVHPQLLDTPQQLDALASRSPNNKQLLNELKGRCSALSGDALVRSFVSYRLALPSERTHFPCDGALESQVPGFYLGANHFDPSTHLGDNFSNSWKDVKFIFHQEGNTAHQWEFVREREYLFRVLNYWVSRGVDGFRFDHTTDYDGGMGSNEWKYLTLKVDYYAQKRGQARPVYLAEEFANQEEMNKVMDIMTEGYVGDMAGRNGQTKNTQRVETVLENMNRFHDRVFTMTALETHDEKRLSDGTGFDPDTGMGFWGIGATTRSTPMMLMGQELGAGWGVGFKRSDFLRSRFDGSDDHYGNPNQLVDGYHTMINAHFDDANRALLSPNHYYLRTNGNGIDDRIFAVAKWSADLNVMFVFHNLWHQDVSNTYPLSDELVGKIGLRNELRYQLRDVLSNTTFGCKSGSELRQGIYVAMGSQTRAQWLRLETCQ